MADLDQNPAALQIHTSACRLFCLMSICSFIFFAPIDLFINTQGIFLSLRAVVIAGVLLIFGLTFTQFGRSRATMLSITIVIWIGISVIWLTELAGGASCFYWTMVMLTYFTASLVLPFTTLQAFTCFLIVTIFYYVWLTINGVTGSTADWVVSNAGIWLSQFVSTLAVWFLSQNRRHRNEQNLQLQQLNTQLRAEIAERERAEEDVVRTQQLDAVGRLAAGMAHEINNVLMVITGTAEYIQFNPNNASLPAKARAKTLRLTCELWSDRSMKLSNVLTADE